MSRPNKNKILSFDLDMTLIDDRTNKIPQSALDAIAKVREDYYIVIATGRDLTLDVNQFVLEQVQPDAWIHNNGTQVHIEGTCVYFRKFDKVLMKRLLEFGQKNQICICANIDNIEYATVSEPLEPILHILCPGNPISLDVWKLLDSPVQTLGLAGTDQDAHILREAFPEVKVTPVIPDTWCDIMEPEVSKVLGMQKVLEHYGFTMEQVIAFGDSMNDYELLSSTGYSVAMGNAADELKKIADFVTDDIDRDGIAKALEAICL